MRKAIELARKTALENKTGGPFGCVIVKDGEIVGEGANTVLSESDPTCHAEMNAIRNACKQLGTHDLTGCTVYSTGEPCPMCYGACWWARVEHIYYASTIQDAKDFGGFDDVSMYEAMNDSIEDRPVQGISMLREEMLPLWEEYRSLPNKAHY